MREVLRWPHHSSEGTQVHKQPLTVSGNARQIELYKRKQKIACVSQPPRARQSGAQRERRERETGVKRAADPFNSTRPQSRRVCSRCAELQRRARRCFWKEETIQSLSGRFCAHPPALLHNISLIQTCHRAKAPHSRGPNPPPNPRQADHPTDPLTSLIWFPNVRLWSINVFVFLLFFLMRYKKSQQKHGGSMQRRRLDSRTTSTAKFLQVFF